MTKIVHLRTEYRKNPLNICGNSPLLSWRTESSERGVLQKSARAVILQKGIAVWDSGIIPTRNCFMRPSGIQLERNKRYEWYVELELSSDTGAVHAESDHAYFETHTLDGIKWIAGTGDGYHIFNKEFTLCPNVARARLSVCALGTAETYINGEPVTDAVLEPGWTDYRKTALYTTYDVTPLLKSGNNEININLGDGMYNVPGGRYVYYSRSFGTRKLCAVLRVEFKNGTTLEIPTDESWYTYQSPIRFCCIYGGEDIDLRTGSSVKEHAVIADAPEMELIPQLIPPEKIRQVYKPVSVTEITGKGWLYDFGTNFSGWVSLSLEPETVTAGCEITITPSEILDKDGLPCQKVTGQGYHWKYTLDSGFTGRLRPDFTYTGFRYALVEGAAPQDSKSTDLPVINDICGCFIYPEFEEEGSFSCSEPLFNRIHEIIRQAMLSNTKSYFTDCPHREKLAWLEQTHLIGPSMLYLWELEPLLTKIARDMEDSQWENGVVPDISPEYVTSFAKWHTGFADSPEWGSACVLVPFYNYRRTGDAEPLRRAYPMMKKYVSYLTSRARHSLLNYGLGDWLDIGPCKPCSQNTPITVTATCVYSMDLAAIRETALVLGYEKDAEEYAGLLEAVREEYNALLLDDQTGRYANGSQTCQAMSIAAGLVPAEMEEKALKQLRSDIEKRGYAITAGDVGHPYLVDTLTQRDMNDLLYKMTLITDRPGYGYQVVNGATTLNEEWDGCEPGNPHGSQNHLMLGSIEGWFFGGLCGIASVRNSTDPYTIAIKPWVPEGMQWAKAVSVHPCGKITSAWERGAEGITYTIILPPDTTAVFTDMDGSRLILGSGAHTLRGGKEI